MRQEDYLSFLLFAFTPLNSPLAKGGRRGVGICLFPVFRPLRHKLISLQNPRLILSRMKYEKLFTLHLRKYHVFKSPHPPFSKGGRGGIFLLVICFFSFADCYFHYRRQWKLLKPFILHICCLCLKSQFLCRPQNIGFIHAVISNGKDMLNLRGIRCHTVKLRDHHKAGQSGIHPVTLRFLRFRSYIFFYWFIHIVFLAKG